MSFEIKHILSAEKRSNKRRVVNVELRNVRLLSKLRPGQLFWRSSLFPVWRCSGEEVIGLCTALCLEHFWVVDCNASHLSILKWWKRNYFPQKGFTWLFFDSVTSSFWVFSFTFYFISKINVCILTWIYNLSWYLFSHHMEIPISHYLYGVICMPL